MQTPLISVIIPVYNVEQYLRQCLDSVIGQTYTNLEIILIDDGSPDHCGEICEEYASTDRRISVIHQSNQGLSAARNAGLDICTGDVIAFVDSDDWIEPDMYERMIHVMLDKDLDVVFCGVAHTREGKILEYINLHYHDGAIVPAEEIIPRCLILDIPAYCWCRLYRRHCVEKMRFPVGWVYEDIPVNHIPFVNATRAVGFLHTPLYNYRRNPRSLSSDVKPQYWIYRYMGRLELYRYAKENVPSVKDRCFEELVKAAVNVCNIQVQKRECDLSADVYTVETFLRENLREILHCPQITAYRKLIVLLRLHAKPLHIMLYRLFKT